MAETTAERWLPVAGYEGLYEVSDAGRVRSLQRHRPRVMTGSLSPGGYRVLNLRRDGVRMTKTVHNLVAEAFHGARPLGAEVRHLDGDRLNCRADNLAYGTHSQNVNDCVAHGTHHESRKTHCPRNHPYDSANTRVYRGKRNCRACERERRARTSAWR